MCIRDSNYEKQGKGIDFCKQIYRYLQEDSSADQMVAIERAKKLFKDKIELTPAYKNPCTTVYQLVEELNQYL